MVPSLRTPADPEENRAAPRRLLEAQISASSQSNFYCGFTEDISEGGVFVAMSPPPPIGELVQLSVRVGANQPVTAIGEVRWHRTDCDGNLCGAGVQFIVLDPRAADLIQGLLARAGQAPLFVE
ncbi:MAG: hypothetical protein EXR71_10655 [Myxococcales bacterium]|nr:hypothetical protein [Myxococcales bacterium]